MLSFLRAPFTSLSSSSSFASSSRVLLPPSSSSLRTNLLPSTSASAPQFNRPQVRGLRQMLAPKRTKHKKSQKKLPIHLPTGGSVRGTTLAYGDYGIRLLESHRLSAAVLQSCRETLRKKMKPIKGSKMYLRVFPDIPICVKGNEVRMGKGKGSFEFWACRVPAGRVIWEISGPGLQEQVAKQAFRLIQVKLPVKSEFINKSSPPRLGSMVSDELTDLRKLNLIPANLVPPPPRSHYRIPSMSVMGLEKGSEIPGMTADPSSSSTPSALVEEVELNGEREGDLQNAMLLADAMGGEVEAPMKTV